jgi:hypothetical protein
MKINPYPQSIEPKFLPGRKHIRYFVTELPQINAGLGFHSIKHLNKFYEKYVTPLSGQ